MNRINKIMNNSLSEDALSLLKIINDKGFESFAVGGCVRDALLGITPKDEDITTNATPNQIISIFTDLGYTVVPTGLQHGTVTVMVNNEGFEITTYRSDGDYSDGRHPDSVNFETNIIKDLERRDLTINAFAWSPRDGFIDAFNGLDDLNNGKIRAVGDANKRIKEDALRMMRAIRFSAKYGFEIEDSLYKAIENNSKDINKVSKERIRDEICKTLMTDNPTYVKKFYDVGLLKYISPELSEIFECPQNSIYHLYDVGGHTMKALEDSPKDLILRVSILFHDIGKPSTKTVDDKGLDHFIDHQEASYYLSKRILQDLKFSSEEVEDISNLVRYHDIVNTSPREKYHSMFRDFIIKNPELDKDFYERLIFLKKADLNAHNLDAFERGLDSIDEMKNIINEILDGPHTFKDLAIKGNDIMEIKKEKNNKIFECKGPAIKEMQKILLKEVIDNPNLNNPEDLKLLCFRNVINSNNYVEISRRNKQKENEEFLDIINKVDEYYQIKEKDTSKNLNNLGSEL